MIFQSLHQLAQDRGLLADLEFVEQKIHWALRLDSDGSLSSVVQLSTKDNERSLSISKIPSRTSRAIACLGADTVDRVIPEFVPDEKPRSVKTQALFLAQLEAVATDTGHEGVQSVADFLKRLSHDTTERDNAHQILTSAGVKATEWVTFMVAGQEGEQLLPEWSAVKDWWRKTAAANGGEPGEPSRCIVTGDLCQPVRTHGTRLKGIPGGRAGGIALVSADKDAFATQGRKKAMVSPMSEVAVEGYIRSINWLAHSAQANFHVRTADTIFLFWSNDPQADVNPGKAVEIGGYEDLQPTADEAADSATDVPLAARRTLTSPAAGNLDAAHAEESARFHCLSLSGSAARAIIRGWLDQPLTAAQRHVEEWFADLAIPLDRDLKDNDKNTIAQRGQVWSRWPLWQLVACLQGTGKGAKAEVAQQRQHLWEAALLGRGHPLPLGILIQACARIPAAGNVNPVRAALIRCLINRLPNRNHPMNKEINPRDESVAFNCGRLLRLLQNLQTTALGDTNATIVSRFYAGASAMPGSVFGTLMAKAEQHRNKIRGDKPGLANWYDDQLADMSDIIIANGGLPATNDPVAQGEFALGFYWQRLHTRREKPEADTSTDESTNESINPEQD